MKQCRCRGPTNISCHGTKFGRLGDLARGICAPQTYGYHLFQITNLMHNSFIFQQYVCYTTLLNMFRADFFKLPT